MAAVLRGLGVTVTGNDAGALWPGVGEDARRLPSPPPPQPLRVMLRPANGSESVAVAGAAAHPRLSPARSDAHPLLRRTATAGTAASGSVLCPPVDRAIEATVEAVKAAGDGSTR